MRRLQHTYTRSIAVLIAFLLIIPITMAQTDNAQIDWWTISSGGGQIQAGIYTLTASIGQHSAQTSQAGSYTLHGGFIIPHPPIQYHRIFLPSIHHT